MGPVQEKCRSGLNGTGAGGVLGGMNSNPQILTQVINALNGAVLNLTAAKEDLADVDDRRLEAAYRKISDARDMLRGTAEKDETA